MQRYTNLVQDNSGNALGGVTVTVYDQGTSNLSTIYTANGSGAKPNPFTNDSDGTLEFYAANGRYDIVFVKSGYTFTAANTTDILFEDTVDGLLAGAVVTGGLVVATGTSASRTLATRFAETLNVRDFGAVGDGVTSDQTAVTNAVAAAVAAGVELFWPAGTYLTTSSVATFHSAKHRGPGIVKRGSTLFYVDPSYSTGQTNNLYISTTGSDTDDGLASSQPRLTLQSMGNVIYNYRYGDITWVVNLEAGTYNSTGTSFSKPFPTPNRVQFNGPNVADGVQPTAIIQGSGSASEIGLYFQNFIRAQVTDINFKRYRLGASPSANQLSSGLAADTFSELYSVNVWTDDCDQGIYITNGSLARIQAGRHGFNSAVGACVQFIRHAKGTVGYNGSAADINGATGTSLYACSYGVMIQEYAMAHVDYCYANAPTLAGILLNTSRCHAVSSTFLSAPVGIDARFNSNLGETTCTYTTCTIDRALRSGSRWAHSDADINEALDIGPPIKEINAVGATTQSATPVTILTKAFEANELGMRGTGFKWSGYFDVTGVAGTKTVVVTLGATTLLTATIAAATLEYKIIVEVVNVTTASSQKCFTTILENGVTPTVAYTTLAEDLTAAKTLTVTHQVTNVADLNRFGWGELEIQH